VLTSQVFVGAFVDIAAQFVLAIGVVFYVLPWMGLELLDTARAVAEFDLPMKVLGLWWGSPYEAGAQRPGLPALPHVSPGEQGDRACSLTGAPSQRS
jgi:hypothetical protein